MDFTTLLGGLIMLLVFLKAVIGYTEGAYHGMLLAVVILGGLSATLVACRGSELRTLLRLPFKVLIIQTSNVADLIARIVGYAETARREGILALEQALKTEKSPFMVTAIRLAVDGTEPRLIQTIMRTELAGIERRHQRGSELLKILAVSWAGSGLIGALGVLALRPGYIGRSGAAEEAALSLLYGAVLAGITLALRPKLQTVSDLEVLHKRMMLEGILSIQAGENPRIIEQKLMVFVEPELRSGAKPKPEALPTEKRPVPEPPAPDQDFQTQVRDVIGRLKQALPDELVEKPKAWTLHDLLDLTETSTRRDILALIGEHEAPQQLPPYDLETIERLADREVQLLLREVNWRDLVVALKGATENVRQRIYANVSERVGTMIKEEMNSGRTQSASVRQVVDVQLRILRVLQLLQEKGSVRKNPDAD